MEDYEKAFGSRRADVDTLLAGGTPRTTAAAHLGGVAVECKLKSLVIQYHRIDMWGKSSCRAKDPKHKQPIERPGHGLISSLKLMQQMYKKALTDRNFLIHLNRVMYPAGQTEHDFIDLRYFGENLTGATLIEWKASLSYVLGWLEKNGKSI